MKEVDKILRELNLREIKAILAFKEKGELTIEEIGNITGLLGGDLFGAVGSLNINEILTQATEPKVFQVISLTTIGKEYAKNGTPETRILSMLKQKKELQINNLNVGPDTGSAIGFLKKEEVIRIKEGGVIELKGNEEKVSKVQSLINKIEEKEAILSGDLSDEEQEIVKAFYRKRGKERGIFRVDERTIVTYKTTEIGNKLLESPELLESLKLLELREKVSQLTPELIRDGSWREKEFREYNIELKPPRVIIGRPHPYQQFLNSVREKLISMGFCEMTGEFVESEFWNMDALYMPQFHPAREIHGIYFVKSPKYAKEIEPQVLDAVSKTHENGWRTGSLGWRYKFDKEQAKRLILRSHGTVLSVRTLALHPKPPGKYFAIARCFRPDPVDATHAPDFFQIEGIVVSKHINFRSLLGLLELFGTEIAGAEKIKFLPSYFPFTEPSVELQVKHPELGWVELGGAGIFRPEVTLSLGVKVPVIAWGLGLDRMAMVALNIHDIRDLFSRDLEFLRKIKF